jgi:hypothetical protein
MEPMLSRAAAALALLLVPGLGSAAGDGAPAHAAAAAILTSLPPELVTQLHQDRMVLLPKLESGARVNVGAPSSAGDGDGGPPGGSGELVQAVVLFSQPRSRAIRLLSQTARQVEFRPELKGIQVLHWYDDGDVEEHSMRIMLVGIRYHLRNHLDVEGSRIWWELDPDYQNDLRSVQGFWQLYDLDDGRTLARFGTRVDVGPALPPFLQEYATRKNVPQTMDHVRRWVDSGGTWRP